MGNNQSYKNRALASLEGKWTNGIIATVIYLLIAGCVGQAGSIMFDGITGYGVSGFWWLLCMPLEWGFTVYFLNLIRNIILSLMFSQTEYIMKDDPQISAADAMKKSAEMMQGHKMELFWLLLSFIGWAILCVLTFGFGFIFLLPYMSSALSHFYEDLKENA